MTDTHWTPGQQPRRIHDEDLAGIHSSEYAQASEVLSEPLAKNRHFDVTWNPGDYSAAVSAYGEMDDDAARWLAEFLARRLSGTIRTLVVDVSQADTVEPLATVLAQAHLVARHRGITIQTIT